MELRKGARFVLLFGLPNSFFFGLALSLPTSWLIAFCNAAALSLASGTCIAYAPVVRDTLSSRRHIDRADLLALGIFCGWFSIVLRAFWGLLWRYYGRPESWIDTHLTGYFIFLTACGAAFHLVAPGAIEQRVPPREWVKIGLLVGLGVFGTMLGSWLLGITTGGR